MDGHLTSILLKSVQYSVIIIIIVLYLLSHDPEHSSKLCVVLVLNYVVSSKTELSGQSFLTFLCMISSMLCLLLI